MALASFFAGLEHGHADQPEHDQESEDGEDAFLERSDGEGHGRRWLQAVGSEATEEVGEQRLAGERIERLVARDAHKHLIPVFAEAVAPGDAEQLNGGVGVAVADGAAVV